MASWSITAMSPGPRRLTRRLVRLPNLTGPVNSGVRCAVPAVPLLLGGGASGLGGSFRRRERGVRRDVLGTAMAGTQGAKARRVSLRGIRSAEGKYAAVGVHPLAARYAAASSSSA